MFEEFKKYLIDLELSENSYSSYLSDLKQYMNYYEDSYGEKLIKLSKSDIRTYILYLKNRLNRKPTTINRIITSLSIYNKFLIEKNIQDDLVVSDRWRIKIQNYEQRSDVPTSDEVNLLKHFSGESKRDFCFIVLLAYGGFRASEITNIKIAHIGLKERAISVYGKGNKFRKVIINDLMYMAITDYLEERLKILPENPYLFIGQKSSFYIDKPMSRNITNRILKKYNAVIEFQKKKKIENLHPHGLRAYFCTNAYDIGYTLAQVAMQAGHANLNTTKGYLGKGKTDLLELSNKM